MTSSPGRSSFFRRSRNFLRSVNDPQGNGPCTHATLPLVMLTPTSYLSPAPRNLWEYHFRLNREGSAIRQSVSSTDIWMLPLSFPLTLLCQLIFQVAKVKLIRTCFEEFREIAAQTYHRERYQHFHKLPSPFPKHLLIGPRYRLVHWLDGVALEEK